VILDVVMPEISGRQVMEAIAAERPETRFLFSSGYSSDVIDTEFLANRHIRIIEKPYRGKDLMAAVRKTLDET